jgi:GNAT superfamily N-acetyltransferase
MLWPTSSSSAFTISAARTATEMTSVTGIFRAYAASLPVDLAPQGFKQELDTLPGVYAPPGGELLLAKRGDHVLGCIAFRPLSPGIAEIKRLFVRPRERGKGIAKALVAAALNAAHAAGYKEIKLDTLPDMAGAMALYKSFGFAPTEPYGSHPYPGLLCFALSLKEKAAP